MIAMRGATSALVLISMPFQTAAAGATAPNQPEVLFPLLRKPPSKHEAIPSSGIVWVDREMRKLAQLPANWDGYGANVIPRSRLRQVADLLKEHFRHGLPEGSLVPGADGSVQMEWHLQKMSFGFLVDEDGSFYAWHKDRETRALVDADASGAVTLLEASVLRALA